MRYMRDIVWLLVHGEWMNKLVTTICWWYSVTSLIRIHKNRCPLLHRYTDSLSNTSRVILRYFWYRYIPYNRVLILVNIETIHSLTAWRSPNDAMQHLRCHTVALAQISLCFVEKSSLCLDVSSLYLDLSSSLYCLFSLGTSSWSSSP